MRSFDKGLRFARRKLDEQALARQKRRYRREHPRPTEATPLFIVGCQRSGTNMIGRTLGKMMEVDYYEESDPKAFDNYRIRDTPTLKRLVSDSDAFAVVFKPICDSQDVLSLLEAHAGSKALWVHRDWRDVGNSAVEHWGEHQRQVILDLVRGHKRWGWRHEGVTDESLAVLKEHARDTMTPHDGAALFWYMRNRLFFDLDLETHPDVTRVKYEQVVSAPAERFRRSALLQAFPWTPTPPKACSRRRFASATTPYWTRTSSRSVTRWPSG